MSHDIDFDQPPRKIDKKKHHSKGFSEEVALNRKSKINFKKYLKDIKEAELLDDADDLNEDE